MPSLPATVQHRLRHLLLNALTFALCYLTANLLAQQQGIVRHAALPFESSIPFLQWMILPYLSSSVFFCLVFFMVKTQDELRVISQRLLLATVVAAILFVIYPLQFSWPRPVIESPWWAYLYASLTLMDKPYNQLPSLHVSYCILFWSALRPQIQPGPARSLLAGWLILTALSTLFTYQHHVLDLVGGALLAFFCIIMITPRKTEPHVAFYYLVAACALLSTGVLAWHLPLALYLMCSLLLVSLAYFRRDCNFLHKRNGLHAWWIWLMYAPYLLGYWLTWHAVVWRERRKPVVIKLTEQLWVGRRLSNAEASQLPADCSIIDLANELSETRALRAHTYRYFPLMDLQTPPPDTVREILLHMRAEMDGGKTVYLHCAMGYSRCIVLAKLYMSQGTLIRP
ncbi:phosphatase PAP2 family protein [Undibacterium sp. CY18W]|uniref:Phosphatase PAP2 family protein n=1 Tax=Undibacterium hunanense TaxID=2762292 RepID=A0ABR6ZSS4_9BURK|nr:phosphatase PAP2 family protein [Undibacterium hunanense]MBC3918957.1 phosphatase PAP2 family protein [Undibacterium hunanense]